MPFRPYFADRLKISLTSGLMSTEGDLALQPDRENNLKVTYAEQAAVTKFPTVDKATSEDFLKWKSLYVTGVNVNTSPLLVNINEVTLADFYSRLTINLDTTLNVQGAVVEQPSAAPTAVAQVTTSASTPSAQTKGESTPIKIAKVTFRGGTVDFSDYFIKPNYSAKLTQLGGRVSDLISTMAILRTSIFALGLVPRPRLPSLGKSTRSVRICSLISCLISKMSISIR